MPIWRGYGRRRVWSRWIGFQYSGVKRKSNRIRWNGGIQSIPLTIYNTQPKDIHIQMYIKPHICFLLCLRLSEPQIYS